MNAVLEIGKLYKYTAPFAQYVFKGRQQPFGINFLHNSGVVAQLVPKTVLLCEVVWISPKNKQSVLCWFPTVQGYGWLETNFVSEL